MFVKMPHRQQSHFFKQVHSEGHKVIYLEVIQNGSITRAYAYHI